MATTLIQFRADEDLKREFTLVYEKLGIDLPTAFRIFMKRSVDVKGIPFSMVLPDNKAIETALDEADLYAEENPARLTHAEMFAELRKI